MNTRKRILTPTEQIHNMLGLCDLKQENPDLDCYPQTSYCQQLDDEYNPVRKRLSTKADLWSLFDNGNLTHYFCTLCGGQKQAFKKPASSTVAMRHVRRFHIDHPKVKELLQVNPDFLQSNGINNSNSEHSPVSAPVSIFDAVVKPSSEIKKPKQVQFETTFVKLVALPTMSIRTAVSKEMREVLQCLDPKMPLPSNVDRVKELLSEQAMEVRNHLREELSPFKGSISTTVGVWKMEKSLRLTGLYVAVMAHFIDEDRLQHRFLGAQKTSSNKSIDEVYRKILADCSLSSADVYRVCVNGSSNVVDSFVNQEEDFVSITTQPSSPKHVSVAYRPLQSAKLTVLNTDVFKNSYEANEEEDLTEVIRALNSHPCIAHDLKLILFNTADETLFKSNVFHRMIVLLDKFQSSTNALTELFESTGQLFSHIRANEWSTWIGALEYYCQHRNSISQIVTRNNWDCLTKDEDNLLGGYFEVISLFLSSIKTLEVSGNAPSISWVYGIIRAINEKSNIKRENPSINHMCSVVAEQMKRRLSYVQEDPIFVISTFLDPATRRHLRQEDANKAIELIADWLKVEGADVSLMNMDQHEERGLNTDDPLLQMLDSFGPRQNDLTSFVQSFGDLVCAEYQRQTDKGRYSSTTLGILQNAASDLRHERIVKIARVVLSVPTSNIIGTESEFIRRYRCCQTEDDIDILDSKLRINLNN